MNSDVDDVRARMEKQKAELIEDQRETHERSLQEKLKTINSVAKRDSENLREVKKKEADAGNPYPHNLRD